VRGYGSRGAAGAAVSAIVRVARRSHRGLRQGGQWILAALDSVVDVERNLIDSAKGSVRQMFAYGGRGWRRRPTNRMLGVITTTLLCDRSGTGTRQRIRRLTDWCSAIRWQRHTPHHDGVAAARQVAAQRRRGVEGEFGLGARPPTAGAELHG